jgi:Domain of unknown function (DUF4352)
MIAVTVALAGCSHSRPHPGKHHKPAAQPSSGQVGDTLAVSDSNGTQLDVTVVKVTNPVNGANSYAKPAKGTHFVGVKLKVRNTAANSYTNNANNETTLVLAGGKKLGANYNPIHGCGNFDNGQVTVKSHATKTGCVTFQVHNGQTVTAVRYGNTVFPGVTAQWQVP